MCDMTRTTQEADTNPPCIRVCNGLPRQCEIVEGQTKPTCPRPTCGGAGAVCCSVLQWCSVLQCGAVCCSVLQCVAVCNRRGPNKTDLSASHVWCGKCVALCAAVCVLQCVLQRNYRGPNETDLSVSHLWRGICSGCVSMCCSVWQCVAVCCSV